MKCIKRYHNGDLLMEVTTPRGDCRHIVMKSQHERIVRVSETVLLDEEENVPPSDYGARALQ